MVKPPSRDRLVDAAFDLFEERGFEETTVDDIAERAGVSRSSFFRQYRSKDDVIFPDHDDMLGAIRNRLDTSNSSTAIVAVAEAVRLVLQHYVHEGDRARRRYRLSSQVPALRNREIANGALYQRLFREFIADWMGSSADSALRAELMAAAVVSAHNHVLRRWLRGDTDDPVADADAAMAVVINLFTPATKAGSDRASVAVIDTNRSAAEVESTIRRALDEM